MKNTHIPLRRLPETSLVTVSPWAFADHKR